MNNEVTLEELKELIAHQWDETTLLDILKLDIHDLVQLLEDHIADNYETILRQLDD